MVTYSFLALLCSIMYALSAVFCKIGLQQRIRPPSFSLINLIQFLISSKTWIFGVVLSSIANIAMIQIQANLDVSIVYSFLNLSYVFVLVLGHYFLKETLLYLQWLGVSVVIFGTLLLLAVTDPASGRDTDTQAMILLTVFSLSTVAFLVASAKVWSNDANYEIFFAICAGICFGCVEFYLKATTNYVEEQIGEFSIFSLSSVVEFVRAWPFIVIFIFGAIGWISLQVTYSHGSVSVSVPIVAVTQRIVSIVGGYFVFNEDFSLLRVIGLTTIVVGVLVLVFASIRTRPQRKTIFN